MRRTASKLAPLATLLLLLVAGCGQVAVPSVLQAYDHSRSELQDASRLDVHLSRRVELLASALRSGDTQRIRRAARVAARAGKNLVRSASRAQKRIARLRRAESAPAVSRYFSLIFAGLKSEAKEGRAWEHAARTVAADPYLVRGRDAALIVRESRIGRRWAGRAVRLVNASNHWKAAHRRDFEYVVVKPPSS